MRDNGEGIYPEKYGAWAGMPKGHAPDLERCCVEVHGEGRWPRFFQCQRKRGHGPNGAYCAQHSPETVAKRGAARDARSQAAWLKRRYEFNGKLFYDVLVKIADGHNDPRGLAQETIDTFTGRATHTSGERGE